MENSIVFTSAKYQAHEGVNVNVQVVIDGVTRTVPVDPDNRHYAEILRQVEAGTLTVEDAD